MKRARFLYILFFLITLYIMIAFGDRFSYVIFYSLIMLLAFSVITLITSGYFIKIKETVEKTDVFKNESLNYGAHISNKGFLPYPKITFAFYHGDYIQYEKTKPEPVSVMGRENVVDDYLISFPYRGKYNIGIEKFYVTDFFGMFKFGFAKKEPIQITVFPEKIENFKLNLRSELLSRSVSSFDMLSDNQADVSDVRKYEPSDDYKKIHWKLTAKRNEFVVKNYLSSVLNKTYIFLDTKNIPLNGSKKLWFEDKMVSYALSAVNYCVMSRLPVSLNYGPDKADTADINGLAEFEGIFRKFAEISFNNESFIAETLTDSLKGDDFYNLVVFILDIDVKLFDSLNNLSTLGHNVIVYYMCAEELKPDIAKQNYLSVLNETGVTVNMLYP